MAMHVAPRYLWNMTNRRAARDRTRMTMPMPASFVIAVVALLVLRPSLDAVLGARKIAFGPAQLSGGFVINVLIVGVAIIMAAQSLLVHRVHDAAVRITALIWIPFLAAAALAATHTIRPIEAVQAFFNYLTYAAVSYLALIVAPQLGQKRLTLAVLYSGLPPIVWALAQKVHVVPYGWADPELYGDVVRVTGTFTHPNILAFYLQVYIAFLFHAQISRYIKTYGTRMTIWAVIGIALLTLLLTGTRAAYMGTYMFLLGYSLLRRPVFLIPLLFLPALALLVPGVYERIADVTRAHPGYSYDYMLSVARGDVAGSNYIQVDSGVWRRFLRQAAWPWVEKRPWMGWGLSTFPAYSLQFFSTLGLEGGTYAHNTFLQLLFEGGIVLLIGFVWMYVASAMQHLANYRFGRGEAIFATMLLLSYALALWSDNVLFYLAVNLQLFFLVFALSSIASQDVPRQTLSAHRQHKMRAKRTPQRSAQA